MIVDDPLPDLLRGLRSPIPDQRSRCARALGRLGPLARDALPLLANCVSDPEPSVREAAAQSIGQMGTEALPHLIRMLMHDDKYVRRHAVWALGKLGPPARVAVPDLCAALRDPDPRTASGAAQSLGNLGPDAADAVPALIEAMCGTNIVLCRLAAKALSQIGESAIPTLIAHLYHRDPFVRGEAALAIGWIGAPAVDAVPALLEVAQRHLPLAKATATPHSQRTPVTAVSPTPPPSSSEDNSRLYAVQALGRIGPGAAAALPFLELLAGESVDPLRQAAITAIRQIRGS